MSENRNAVEQNLIDAGCDRQFIETFLGLNDTQKAKMLKMLAAHRKTLLDGIHDGERRIYCLDYLVNKLKNTL